MELIHRKLLLINDVINSALNGVKLNKNRGTLFPNMNFFIVNLNLYFFGQKEEPVMELL